MKFILRDDDTCYFTKPEHLEKAFGHIWDTVPVSLAVIPFVGKGLPSILDQDTIESGELFPIGDNAELVTFLKKQIQKGHVEIMLHGYSHEDVGKRYEFEAADNLKEKVAKGKSYLEELFGVEITTFVPPHNAMSPEGLKAVQENNLNLYGIPHYRNFARLKDIKYWPAFIKKALYKLQHNYTYPDPIRINNHYELSYFSLTPSAKKENLERAFQAVRKDNGLFTLATHYIRLQDEGYVKNIFDSFIQSIMKDDTVEFTTPSNMLNS